MRNPRLLPGEALTNHAVGQKHRVFFPLGARSNALKVWILRSLLRLCMLAWLKKSLLTVNLFPISILPSFCIYGFLASFQPSLSSDIPIQLASRASECLESWALELECGMMVDTWIRIQPFFWQGKNWNQQRRVFLDGGGTKISQRLSLIITITIYYNIAIHHILYSIISIILYDCHTNIYKYHVIIVMGLLTSLQNFLPSHHVGVSLRGCTGEPLSWPWIFGELMLNESKCLINQWQKHRIQFLSS